MSWLTVTRDTAGRWSCSETPHEEVAVENEEAVRLDPNEADVTHIAVLYVPDLLIHREDP